MPDFPLSDLLNQRRPSIVLIIYPSGVYPGNPLQLTFLLPKPNQPSPLTVKVTSNSEINKIPILPAEQL